MTEILFGFGWYRFADQIKPDIPGAGSDRWSAGNPRSGKHRMQATPLSDRIVFACGQDHPKTRIFCVLQHRDQW